MEHVEFTPEKPKNRYRIVKESIENYARLTQYSPTSQVRIQDFHKAIWGHLEKPDLIDTIKAGKIKGAVGGRLQCEVNRITVM
jgi:hypothetical protein